MAQIEQSLHTQMAGSEHQQQKIRELELELARNSATRSVANSLQEELQAERARVIAADKKVSVCVCGGRGVQWGQNAMPPILTPLLDHFQGNESNVPESRPLPFTIVHYFLLHFS